MSLDEHTNEMAANGSNKQPAKRTGPQSKIGKARAENSIRIDLYKKLDGKVNLPDGKEAPEHLILSFSVSLALGFLSGFVDEVRGFRQAVDQMAKLAKRL